MRGLYIAKVTILNEFSYYTNDVFKLSKTLSFMYNKQFALNYSSATEAFWSLFSIINTDVLFLPKSGFHSALLAAINSDNSYKIIFYEVDEFLFPILDDLQSKIPSNSRVSILVNNLCGIGFNIEKLRTSLPSESVIILDASHSHYNLVNGKYIIEYTDISILSLQGAKSVPAGEGGFILTDNQQVHEKLVAHSHFNNQKLLAGINQSTGNERNEFGVGHKHRINAIGASLALFSIQNHPYLWKNFNCRNGKWLSETLGYYDGENSDWAMGFPISTSRLKYHDLDQSGYGRYLEYPSVENNGLDLIKKKTTLFLLRSELLYMPPFLFRKLIKKIIL